MGEFANELQELISQIKLSTFLFLVLTCPLPIL